MGRALVLLLLAGAAVADEASSSSSVSGERALDTLKVLASDAFGGRKSGLESGRKAEEWMAARLAELKLQKPNGFTYFHEFKASVTTHTGGAAPVLVAKGGAAPARTGAYLEDYVTLIYSGAGQVEAPVVFAGYGIHAPAKGRDDYAGLDVKGTIVLALRGKPDSSAFDEERFIGYKSSVAADRGAVGFLLVEGDTAVPGTIQEKYHRETLPAVWISRAAADDLFSRAGKGTLADQAKALAEGKPASFALDGVTARLEIFGRLLRDQPMRNVVGVWPGLTDETVVLGAHLDHVGTDAAGNVYNGADDNASGSSMLLEIARAVVARGETFRRSILFCWFAGEEQGLLGAHAFVKTPPVPLEKIAVMINTDMVGQGKPVMAVGGKEVYPLDATFLNGFDFGFETRFFRAESNSDHYPFQAAGVPAFFVHTVGPHPNYHMPADDWPNMDPALIETAGRFVRKVAEWAARSPAPHCRPHRHAEYVWHDARVFDPDAEEPRTGVDLRVQWFDGNFVALDDILRRLEAKGAEENLLKPGVNLGARLNDLRPTVALGLRGRAAVELHRPARRLGVILYAPFRGTRPVDDPGALADLIAFARETPVVLDLTGGADVLGANDVRSIPGALLVGPREAAGWRDTLAARPDPWQVLYPLGTVVDAAGPGAMATSSARTILDLRKAHGADHVTIVHRRDPRLRPHLILAHLAATLKPAEIRQLLDGNLVRLLEPVVK